MHEPRAYRRRLALLACLLWIAGFELAPGVHIGFHELFGHHHHHGAGAHHHHHDSRRDTHAKSRDQDRSERAETGKHSQKQDSEHGKGSLAHRGLAVVESPPPPVPLPVLLVAKLDDTPFVDKALTFAPPPRTRARGPPL